MRQPLVSPSHPAGAAGLSSYARDTVPSLQTNQRGHQVMLMKTRHSACPHHTGKDFYHYDFRDCANYWQRVWETGTSPLVGQVN